MTECGRLVVIATPSDAPSARAEAERAAATTTWTEGDLPPAGDVVAAVAGGRTVAVSVAGTAASSEAMAAVVAAVVDAGLPVEVVPAPDPAVAALVASGLATDHVAVDPPLPADGPARADRLARLAAERRTTALPVAPDRLPADLDALAAACGPDRPLAVAVGPTAAGPVWRGTVGEAAGWAAEEGVDGDAILVVSGTAPVPGDGASDAEVRAALRDARERGLSPGRAAAEVAAATGRTRRQVYALGQTEPSADEDGA